MSTISFRVTREERAMRAIVDGYDVVHHTHGLSPAIARKLEAAGRISVDWQDRPRRAVLTDKGREWLAENGMRDTVLAVVEASRCASLEPDTASCGDGEL